MFVDREKCDICVLILPGCKASLAQIVAYNMPIQYKSWYLSCMVVKTWIVSIILGTWPIKKRRLSIQQHCGHWWHRKWSLQLTVSPVTTKLSHWPSFVFSAPAYAMNNIYFFSVVVTHWLNFKRTLKKCKHNLYEISKLQHFETCQQSTPTTIIKTVWLIQNGVSWCFLVGISSY